MFGRKPPSDGDLAPTPNRIGPTVFQAPSDRPTPPTPPRPVAVSDVPATASPRSAPPPPAWGASAGQPIRRPAEPIRAEPPRAEPPRAEPPRSETLRTELPRAETARDVRKLIVGRDINLSGEITACDHLIVEGTVEARVRDCYRLEVAESGLFQGSVEIREADIAGRFLGELIVQGRLSVRATGKVEGKIQYGELAVDAGGTLDGEVRVNGKSPRLVADIESVKPAVEAQATEPKSAEAQSVEPRIETPVTESPAEPASLP